MRYRRALTLVEVLAATVLMAILAGTCMPLLQRAMRASHEPEAPFELLALAQLADWFIGDPAVFGLEMPWPSEQVRVPWPDHPDRPPVTVRGLMAGDPDLDHAWLVFSCEGLAVFRWIPVDDQGEEPGP